MGEEVDGWGCIENNNISKSKFNINNDRRIMSIEQNKLEIAVIKESMKQNREDHDDIKKCITGLEAKMDKFIDSAPQKFASKRTEQLFYTLLGGLALYVGYKIVDLI